MSLRRLASAVSASALLLVSALGLAGCGHKGITQPLGGPHTTIFIDVPVDTQGVNHVVHLHWFGSDPHGYIAGYDVRLIDSTAVAVDTGWVFTTRTDSVVTVPTPTGYASKVFEARAINDRGVKDPNPPRQHFYFRNLPPIVRIVTKPNRGDKSDTTFASATITWSVSDVDGDASKVITRIWLDGHGDSPVSASGTSFTVPSEQFQVAGAWASGRRTLYIRGIDDGGLAGPIDSVSWYVKAPVDVPDAQGYGRLLLIDDLPSNEPSNPLADALYFNNVSRAGLPPGSWRLLRLQTTQPFRSPEDLEQTCKQFRAVVWYRGPQPRFAQTLSDNAGGIPPYVRSGGKFYVESLNLVETWSSSGPFDQDFVQQNLDADGVFVRAQPPDSSASWGLVGGTVLQSPVLQDSLRNAPIIEGMNAFIFRNPSEVLLYAPAHTMTQDNPIDFALALSIPQANDGLLIVSSYPLVLASIDSPQLPQRASGFLAKVLQLLGATGP